MSASSLLRAELRRGAAEVPAPRRRLPGWTRWRTRIRCSAATASCWRWTWRASAPADAQALLIISSACHGVEGFCGSGVQNALLADPAWHAAAERAGVAVLYIHALNPYGFSWLRRTTHENVDLNRNFQDFSKPLPHNEAYDRLAHLLVPAIWPPTPEVKAGLAEFVAEHGQKALAGRHLERAVRASARACSTAGATRPGATRPCAMCCATMAGAARAWAGSTCTPAWGPAGMAERIFAGPDDAAAMQRARAWWGTQMTSMYDGSSESALLTGLMWMRRQRGVPAGRVHRRGDGVRHRAVRTKSSTRCAPTNGWRTTPMRRTRSACRSSGRLRDAFYTDTDAWKTRIVEQGVEAAYQGVAGLGV